MIVEFAGCTGSGKSVFRAAVQRELAKVGCVVATSRDLGWGSVLAERVPVARLRNPTIEFAGLSLAVPIFVQYHTFISFCCRTALTSGDGSRYAFRALRGVWRQLCLREAARRTAAPGAVVLLDESTIQTAHYILAVVSQPPTLEAVQRFCELAPMPDLLIYVRASEGNLISRMTERPDPPRRNLGPRDMANLVTHAVTVFEAIRERLSGDRRVLVVQNDQGISQLKESARMVATRIAGTR